MGALLRLRTTPTGSRRMVGRPAVAVRELVARYAGIIDACNQAAARNTVSAATNDLAGGRRFKTHGQANPVHFPHLSHRQHRFDAIRPPQVSRRRVVGIRKAAPPSWNAEVGCRDAPP